MPVEVIMPKVDMDMESGKLGRWHVEPGAKVSKGDPLFDIETDKAAMEVEAPSSGTLQHVLAQEGDVVVIGAPVAWIYTEGEEVGPLPATAGADGAAVPADVKAASQDANAPSSPVPALAEETSIGASRQDSAAEERPRATPAARRAAAADGLALNEIVGSGPRGRIQRSDVAEMLKQLMADGPRSAPVATAAPAREQPSVPAGAHPLQWQGAGASDLPVRYLGPERAPPVLLIHGFASDATSWGPLEKMLARNHRICALDLPGHGRAAFAPVANFADLVSAVRARFDRLGFEQMHLVGHSLGGAVALALADTRPRRVASLSLICPAGLGPQINGEVLSGITRATAPESLGPWLRCLTGDPDTISWGYVQAAANARQDPQLRAAQAQTASALFPDGTQAFDLTAALDRLDIPTRIVWGKRDQIIPWQHALKAPGRVALHFFDGLGHIPHIEAPDEIAALLQQQFATATRL